ncbi:MAG: DUF1854 domain-containing protein, partial [Eubacteriales bacterium]|nr:DUF1854 domain-containing protein [Eubacteriales bacterium]
MADNTENKEKETQNIKTETEKVKNPDAKDPDEAKAESKESEKAADESKESEESNKPEDSEKSDKSEKEEKKYLDEIDGGEEGDLILENQRESIPLNPKNARFFRSKGNLISLELNAEGKETEVFERVVILRSFPVTNPDEFLSVREPDAKKKGRGKEIGMIRRMSDFDEATTMLFLEELDRRYFSPQILRIISAKEKFGYSYWDAETTAGHV